MSERKFIPLPAFLPDQLPNANILTVAKNLYPAQTGYRAVQGFEGVSQTLPAEFRGGFSVISTDGTAFLLAGTSNGLARLASGEWSDLLVALTVPGRWRFTQFGNFVVAVNGGTTQEVNLTAGTASELTGAPTATDLTVVGNHIVYAQPNGDKLRVRWSAFGDHTGNTLGADQAGDQPMLTGGEVMGIAGGEYGVILQRQRLVRMSLTGDANAPFQFDAITDNYGCASKASIAVAGRTVFFLSDRGFMALDDGQAIRQIGNEKFDRTFRAQIGTEDFERVWSAVDPVRPMVYWGIPGSPGTIWVYDFALDRASTIEMPFDGLFAGFEDSVTLEGLSAIYPDLDTMPYSLDDPRFSGGSPRMYLVTDGQIGTLTGQNMKATLVQSQFAPAGNEVLRVRAFWPETDATEGVTITADMRQRKGDPEARRTATGPQTSGRTPLRHRGRFLSVRIEIESPDWSYIEGYGLEASTGGER